MKGLQANFRNPFHNTLVLCWLGLTRLAAKRVLQARQLQHACLMRRNTVTAARFSQPDDVNPPFFFKKIRFL